MKTYEDFYNELQAEYPTILIAEDDVIIELDDAAYEAKLNEWANNLLEKQTAELAAQEAEKQAEVKRVAALAKLEALGLDEDDLKALGL